MAKQRTLEPSQTSLECEAYFSTMGRMLDVTMRWARLKLWSISVAECQVGGGHVECGELTLQC